MTDIKNFFPCNSILALSRRGCSDSCRNSLFKFLTEHFIKKVEHKYARRRRKHLNRIRYEKYDKIIVKRVEHEEIYKANHE